jgi:hypothetical protein
MRYDADKVNATVKRVAKREKLKTWAQQADAIGVSIPTLRRTVLHGLHPSMETLCLICAFTGKKPNYFFTD